MRIKLTLRRPQEQLTDIEVTADATATVADVARALYLADPLRQESEVPDGMTLQVQNPGADPDRGVVQLDPGQDLIMAGLRSGTVVSLARTSRNYTSGQEARGETVALLRVLTGPDRGREFPLPAGATVLGRDPEVDVRLADPLLSKRHARLNVADAIEVSDLGSANGVVVGGDQVERAALTSTDVVALGDTTFTVIPLQRRGGTALSSPVVEFNRSPRVVPRFPQRPLLAPEPPKQPPENRFPFMMLIAPVIMGGLIFFITGRTYSLIIIFLMPLMAIANWLDRRHQAKKNLERQTEQFQEGMAALKRRVTAEQEVERAVRMVETPSTADTVDAVQRHGRLLWTHRPEHDAFATVRIGLGVSRSRVVVELPSSNNTLPAFWDELLDVAEEYASIAGVPIVADLRETGALGVAGTGPLAAGVARGLVLQTVGLHSPAELAVAAITSRSSHADWNWLKWLPHTSSPHSPLAGDHLAETPGRGAALLARLEELVDARAESSRPAPRGAIDAEDPQTDGTDEPVLTGLLVVVEDDAPVDRARLVRLAERGADVGVHVLWCAPVIDSLPAACRTYVTLDAHSGNGVAGHVRHGTRTDPVSCETVEADVASGIARALAPLVDAGVPIDDDSDLPRSVSYLRLGGMALGEDPDRVLESWRQNGSLIRRDGSAPVRLQRAPNLRGLVGHDGVDLFSLDLRANGPHALVGGTTGAGKSEFLQSWVLGMATAHSPDRVTFLFVDYKGGAAFSECVTLPHSVGLVTDLSPHLVRRALTSLRAELHHREELLHRKNAKDLVSLEKTGDPETPPSLVIVVDEFAALATEVPEFVDGVVDVAARGRSLGLHLILATQRPAGVIKDNLRANTNLRIALRMADEADSADILGDKMAAHFDPAIPGRGAAKTGPGRISTFQSGYAGGWTAHEPETTRIDVVERPFGTGEVWEEPVPETGPEQDPGPNDIARIVATVTSAARDAAVPPPRKPWLAEMATVYDLSKLPGRRTDDDLLLGVRDVPERQAQPPVSWEPDTDGNLAVFGTSGSGKSSTLRTIAISAAVTPRGGPVHVYGLDFGSSGLDMLAELPHVASIVDGDDEERGVRLLRRLKLLVDQRAEDFAEARAGSIAEYRRLAGRPDEPRILLLVDGMSAFREAYEATGLQQWFTTFVQIATDGRQVGVHVVVSGNRPNAVPNSLGSSIQRRIVHRMASADDYLALGVGKDILDAETPPGRGVLEGHEVQIAVLGGDANTAVQAREVTKLGAAMRRQGIPEAPPVRRLPTSLPLSELPATVAGLPALGMADETLGPAGFEPAGAFTVSGPPQSGRTTALLTMATALRRAERPLRILRLSAVRSPLVGQTVWDLEASEADQVRALCAELRGRLDADELPEGSLAVFLESVGDFAGTGVEAELEKFVRSAIKRRQFVVGESELASWKQVYALSNLFKSAKTGLIVQPSDGDTDSLLGTQVKRVQRTDFPPGRGLLVARGRATKLQVAEIVE